MIINSKVIDVVKAEKDKKYEKYWYNVLLENGLLYRAAFYNDISFCFFSIFSISSKDGKKDNSCFVPPLFNLIVFKTNSLVCPFQKEISL